MSNNHPFHLVDVSPWPLLGSLSAMTFMSSLIAMFHFHNTNLIWFSLLNMMLIMYQWWRDITREASYMGIHTLIIVNGMRWGMILFITSEVLFFLSFFWGFFHNSLTPTIELGMSWPPKGIAPFNPIQIPLLNTLILLSSGLTVTWAHHSLMENNYKQAKISLILTVVLGIYFSFLQGYEYLEASFSMADSAYGSSFFMSTGFHGIHVIIGTTFLLIMLMRHSANQFSKTHHFGFEAAAWYWHFVDVVWLFLYLSIYWWGS
uniref:Cytochrome c oxidase subunit 3 n=1 Tax=Crypsis chinensis TaxID=2984370 RepID=A0A978D4Z0_9CUCU|nr:cytochrome c oxidase subunit III [Crypsis chinensis]UYB79087.1 cytochrome c oxidase subunit III [Crypsis chinensis]